jgi:phospholipid/cholesterol/gamma-HCH transport system ATP-binding protein
MATLTSRPMRSDAEASSEQPVVVIERVSLAFDDKVVLKDVSFELLPGHTKLILGASGSGKSTILKLILGFLKPDSGAIWVNGHRVDTMTEGDLMAVRAGIGMVFQESALFDSITVGENVGYKLYEEIRMPFEQATARVEQVLGFIGLHEYLTRMPSELSGGQRRRVAIARAIAAKPGLILYDEATTGLDPITAMTVDEEMVKLRDLEGVSSIIVTHQLRDAFFVATHEAVRDGSRVRITPADPVKSEEAEFVMLREGLVAFEGTASELRGSKDPYIRSFLS